MKDTVEKSGLELLRQPFPAHLISKLPKPTCKIDEWNKLPKSKCEVCGGYHPTSKTIHLDFVGHAALTDRLLDCDPQWNWEPVCMDSCGFPMLDKDGGMWIKLTVCGVTRLGYGDAQGKTGPNATKERIGDALRNAAMRFGAALDLWSKADLHADDDHSHSSQQEQKTEDSNQPSGIAPWTKKDLATAILAMKTTAEMDEFMAENTATIAADLSDEDNKSFLKWFDTQRIVIAKKEAAEAAK